MCGSCGICLKVGVVVAACSECYGPVSGSGAVVDAYFDRFKFGKKCGEFFDSFLEISGSLSNFCLLAFETEKDNMFYHVSM